MSFHSGHFHQFKDCTAIRLLLVPRRLCFTWRLSACFCLLATLRKTIDRKLSIESSCKSFDTEDTNKCRLYLDLNIRTSKTSTSPQFLLFTIINAHTPCRRTCSDWFYTVSGKKGATLFFAITLPNPNRSSKFFHNHTQQ